MDFSLGDVFKEVLRTSSGRRLGDGLKKSRRNFHFRPIYDIFETQIKTFLRRLYDVFVSAGMDTSLGFNINFSNFCHVSRSGTN